MDRFRRDRLRVKLGRHRVFEAQGKLAVIGLLLLAVCHLLLILLILGDFAA